MRGPVLRQRNKELMRAVHESMQRGEEQTTGQARGTQHQTGTGQDERSRNDQKQEHGYKNKGRSQTAHLLSVAHDDAVALVGVHLELARRQQLLVVLRAANERRQGRSALEVKAISKSQPSKPRSQPNPDRSAVAEAQGHGVPRIRPKRRTTSPNHTCQKGQSKPPETRGRRRGTPGRRP
jgi:hypothetical protein